MPVVRDVVKPYLNKRGEIRLVNGILAVPLIISTKHRCRIKRIRGRPFVCCSLKEVDEFRRRYQKKVLCVQQRSHTE